MANVMTLQQKNAFKRQRFVRAIGVAMALVSLALCIGLLSLLPAYVQARNAFIEQEQATALLEQAQNGNRASIGAESLLARAQVEALMARRDAHTTASLAVVLAVHESFGSSIAFSRVAFGRVNGVRTLTVSGVARDRDTLNEFGRALTEKDITAEANIPVAFLADKQNVEFTIPIPLEVVEMKKK